MLKTKTALVFKIKKNTFIHKLSEKKIVVE